ncbi:MAG TPA: RnfABCDGE type electron transport complex subunit D [Rhodospirillaceae bacterium]|nr:RnfABCDGE type electron transport complex subunit D [Rhodospirillaceae bacterium]
MNTAAQRSAPFAHAPTSIQNTMSTVLLALIPATLFDAWLFGWPAIVMFLTTVGSCLAAEAACLHLGKRPLQPTLFDGSAALTGWLLAMSLPPWSPWWISVIGAIFSICLAKHVFGGLGQNPFNPAMVGRIALLVSFPLQMTSFIAPRPLMSAGAPGLGESLAIIFGGHANLDGISAASALGYVKTELSRGIPVSESASHVPNLMDMAMGMHPGSFGETSALLILAGGLFLLARRVISWHIPVAVIATLFFMGSVFSAVDPGRFTSGSFQVFSGATFLGAFFIATDYVTSPVSKPGQLVFGFGVGLLTWVIRSFAGYPEGMAFAVLLMNALTPLIDHHIRPRAFGRTRKGDPLPVKGE